MNPRQSSALQEPRGPGARRPPAVVLAAVVVAGLVLGLVAAAFTGVGGLQLRRDHRVTILSPQDRAVVPEGGELEVRWAVRDFTPLPAGREVDPSAEVADDTGFFGVFVNTYLPAPGQSLVDWARKRHPRQCPADFCSGRAALAALGALSTSDTTIAVASGVNIDPDRTQPPGVTIVLLNARGERIGDSFWYLPTTDDSVKAG